MVVEEVMELEAGEVLAGERLAGEAVTMLLEAEAVATLAVDVAHIYCEAASAEAATTSSREAGPLRSRSAQTGRSSRRSSFLVLANSGLTSTSRTQKRLLSMASSANTTVHTTECPPVLLSAFKLSTASTTILLRQTIRSSSRYILWSAASW